MEDNLMPFFMKDVMDKANQGDGDACFDVAEFYYAQKDFRKAFLWNKKASECAEPNPGSFFNLGYAYQYGEGTDMDMFAAFDAYQKAADLGVPQAMNNLAMFYETGIVVPRDLDKADDLCRTATKILNNLQTELYKVKRQYDLLMDEKNTLSLQVEELKGKESAAKGQMLQALQEVNSLQKKMNDMEDIQRQMQRQSEAWKIDAEQKDKEIESIQQERESLQKNLDSLKSDFCSEQKKNSRLTEESRKKAQDYIQNEESLKSVRDELLARNQTVENLRARLNSDEVEIDRLRKKGEATVAQITGMEQIIANLRETNEKLQQQKPFVKKKTMLVWLDGWFLLFLSGINLLSFYSDLGCFHMDDPGASLQLLFPMMLTILCWFLLNKERYILHGVVCLLITVANLFLPMVVLNDFDILSVFTEQELCVRLFISVAYCWLGCVSMLKETIE